MNKKTIGILGTGKTGSEVIKALNIHSDYNIVAFDQKNKPTPDSWRAIDAAICFLPGPAFLEYLDLFLKYPKPMVIGSTGFELSSDQNQKINDLCVPWVMSFNFSLGMALAKEIITKMSLWAKYSGLEFEQRITETHHVHKKDAPSGTALLWKSWSAQSQDIKITSHRVEDHCGLHEYFLELPQETMSFKHDAKSRAVFAEGALWSLHKILIHTKNNKPLKGRIDFFDLVAASTNPSSKENP